MSHNAIHSTSGFRRKACRSENPIPLQPISPTRILSFAFIVCLLLGITLVSCIRDEALNAEADILTCTVPGDILKRDPIIENNKVVLMVTADADLTHQAPEFTLTPGATISPASGTERDFTTPQFYTVTSEDGNWKKEYQVTYIIAGISSEYHFENVKDYKSSLLKYVYNIFYENDSEGKWVMDWASGNTGFALTFRLLLMRKEKWANA